MDFYERQLEFLFDGNTIAQSYKPNVGGETLMKTDLYNYVKLDEAILDDIKTRKGKLKQDLVELDKQEEIIQNALSIKLNLIEKLQSNIIAPLSKEDILDKPKYLILQLMAERNNNWLVMQLAIDTMVKAGVLQPETASGEAYTLVAKYNTLFEQVMPGIYKLIHQKEESELITNPKTESKLTEKVLEILSEHPNWSRKQVKEELLSQNWDFKGKHPSFSVSMAFANLNKKQNKERFEKTIKEANITVREAKEVTNISER